TSSTLNTQGHNGTHPVKNRTARFHIRHSVRPRLFTIDAFLHGRMTIQLKITKTRRHQSKKSKGQKARHPQPLTLNHGCIPTRSEGSRGTRDSCLAIASRLLVDSY